MTPSLAPETAQFAIKQPKNLSARIQWLRDYYFQGTQRRWNNEYTAWTTGTRWDFQYKEISFYIVPETYAFLQTFRSNFCQTARPLKLPVDFWKWSLPERKAWFTREVMVNYLPQEMLPGDLLAGARFNVMTSCCLTQAETRAHDRQVLGRGGARETMQWFHNHGFGNSGATSGHLIPDYGTVIQHGWKSISADIAAHYAALSPAEQSGKRGAQLRAMQTAAGMARALAARYRQLCLDLAQETPDAARRGELHEMAENLARVPWEPAQTFWEAIQSLWLTHMLVMSDENYPGPGVSFGRIDQYLYPAWEYSLSHGMEREWGKEILKCFFLHANTAYDGMIRTGGNQGITAGYGQLFNISGMGSAGQDLTNDLTYALLEVIDELSPLLEPKPNVRLHRGSPPELLDKVTEMIASSQGAPFLINFDERSMAGMMREARMAGLEDRITLDNVSDYASVGCLENTMAGNDRSGTVDNNLNLVKAVELALTGGYDLLPFTDPLTGKTEPLARVGAETPPAEALASWEDFWQAYLTQTRSIIQRIAAVYEKSEEVRARFFPTPYLSCLVKGCAGRGLDVTEGGAELSFTTIEGVTYATTVNSLLAIRYLVYEKKACTLPELVQALKDNWVGHEVLQARAQHKAPKYGRDEPSADALGQAVMRAWSEETWKYTTVSTQRRFRPGMLSWNYWIAYSDILPASADGRQKGRFLSNAMCPSNGADTNGPTANVNSVGTALGGKAGSGQGDWQEYINYLPNGGSHTITFSPALVSSGEHRAKFRAFLQGYIENGGTALQVNILDAAMLRDAQAHPENYRHLLVRVTGYNAYFTSIGKELQDEIIARQAHEIH